MRHRRKGRRSCSGTLVRLESFPVRHRIPTTGFLLREKPKEPGVKRDSRRYDLIPSEILALKRGEDVARNNGVVVPFAKACHPVPKPRSYAFAADTRYWESVSEFVKGVDVLYHEATFGQAMKQRAEKTFHNTAAQAGRCGQSGGGSTDHRAHLSALHLTSTICWLKRALNFREPSWRRTACRWMWSLVKNLVTLLDWK